MLDYSKFSHDVLAKMLDNPALSAHHEGILAHLTGMPTAEPKKPAKRASKAKKQPAKKPAPKTTEKTYTVDEGAVHEQIGNDRSGTTVSSYTKGYLRLKSKNFKGNAVFLYKEDIEALEKFIKANRSRFQPRPTK